MPTEKELEDLYEWHRNQRWLLDVIERKYGAAMKAAHHKKINRDFDWDFYELKRKRDEEIAAHNRKVRETFENDNNLTQQSN